MNRSRLFLGVAIAASAGALASCSSGVGGTPTLAHTGGLKDVKDPACTRAELRRIGPTTPRIRVAPNPKRTGVLNTRQTAVKIELGTLLLVSVRPDNTLYLATPSGCWVKSQTRIRNGVMTAAFLMNRAGYPSLEYVPYHPYSATDKAQDTYFHVVRH